jgi:dynein heavy chain
MVYMQPTVLGYRCLFDSWINTLPKTFTAKNTFVPTLNKMYDDWVVQVVEVLRLSCKECSPTMNNNIVSSLFKLLNCFFVDFIATEIKKVEPEEIDHLDSVL